MATKEEAVDALISALDEYVLEQADMNNATPTRVKHALRQALFNFLAAAVTQPEARHVVAHRTQEASRQISFCKGCLREHVPGHCLPADV